jgi:hypothetical protein
MQRKAAVAIRALNELLPTYLDKALRLAQFEGLSRYEAAVAELATIKQLIDTLRTIYRAIQRRCKALTVTLAATSGYPSSGVTSNKAATASSLDLRDFVTFVNQRSDLATNVAWAIDSRVNAVPCDLLHLPSAIIIEDVRERRRIERERTTGPKPRVFLAAWEQERKIPFFGFDKRMLPTDPWPWIKIIDLEPLAGKLASTKVASAAVPSPHASSVLTPAKTRWNELKDGATRAGSASDGVIDSRSSGMDAAGRSGFISSIVQLFSAAAGKPSRDDLVPQPGHVWAEGM